MTYNSWKLMDKITVAVKTSPDESYRGRVFDGYIVEAGDEDALEKAKSWAREREYDYDKKEYTTVYEPAVYTFDNAGFKAKIIDSAGGSSQGGRLSFWACEVEKDGVKFTIGVNDAILADLIKNSNISNGRIQQEVMFARKGGQPGLIHGGMDAYTEARADMKQKADLKSAKKTSRWEIGGVYKTLTQADVCLGEVWDTMEEHTEQTNTGWYGRTQTVLRKAAKPKKVMAWLNLSSYRHKEDPKTFEELLKIELDTNYIHFSTGKPPARAKATQLLVKISDMKILDELLAKREEYEAYTGYGNPKVKGRFVRELN